MAILRTLLLETPRFAVYNDHVTRREGAARDYYYVTKPSAVTVVLHTAEEMLFLRTTRHRCPGLALELPGGRIESGESAIVAARRELKEELGISSLRLRRMGVVYALASVTDERVFMFHATLSTRAKTRIAVAEDEGIESLRWVRLCDVPRVIAKTIRSAIDGYAALLFLTQFSNGG